MMSLLLLALLGPGKPVEPAEQHWPYWRGAPSSTGIGTTALPDQLVELWTFKTKDMIAGAPAISGNIVYVASMDRHLYALEFATGKLLWKQKLGLMKASPTLHNGRVSIGDIDGKVYCRDAKTGDAVWVFDNESGEIANGANTFEKRVLVSAQGMPVTCLGDDGKKAWTYEIDGGSNGTPSLSGNVCVASGCDSHFHAVNAESGEALWRVELPGQAAATACIDGDVAFIGTVTNQVVAIDMLKRKKLWQFEPSKKAQPFYSSAAVNKDCVFLGSRDRKVYALNKLTGKEVWSVVTEGAVDASPVVVGTRLYVGCLSLTGEFYVLDTATGKIVQEIMLDSAVTGSVAVANGAVLVGTEKGTLYCFGKTP